MDERRRARGSTLPTLAATAALVTLSCVLPASASAVTLSAKPDVYRTVDAKASLDASERAGLAMLLVDGTAVRASAVETTAPAVFAGVPLAPGLHTLRVLVRSAGGVATSHDIVVRSWAQPAAPAVSGLHAGLYKVTTPLTVSVGANTTKLTAIMRGKVLWYRYAPPGTRGTYTFTLPPGASVIEFRAENPSGSTSSRKVSVFRAVWPAPSWTNVGSEFGMRGGRMHKGIDIHAPDGSAAVAAGPGRVIWAENLTSYGGLVIIDHGGHNTTYYAHLSRISVRLGQIVTAGQRVGSVGSGHLHFQVYVNALGWSDTGDKYRRVNSGVWTDPRLWIGYP